MVQETTFLHNLAVCVTTRLTTAILNRHLTQSLIATLILQPLLDRGAVL